MPVAVAANDTDALHPFVLALTVIFPGQVISGDVAVANVHRPNQLMAFFSIKLVDVFLVSMPTKSQLILSLLFHW
jgi:hypothetical protein